MSKSTPEQKTKSVAEKIRKTAKSILPKTKPLETSKTMSRAQLGQSTAKKKSPTKQVIAKKTAVKKPVVKKASTKQTPVKAQVKTKAATSTLIKKKSPAKKVIAKKTAVKKPVARKTSAKQKPSKTPVQAKPAPSTLTELHQALLSLETRMKRANTRTRNNVKSLQTSVQVLGERSNKTRASDKAVLTRKVNTLSDKLTAMVTQTQNSVNAELKTALSNPSLDVLKSAIYRADQKISQSETLQSQAISKINRHLAAMATTIDEQLSSMNSRITAEETARKADIDTLKTESFAKIETAEKETASVIRNMGDKIVELSEQIKRRGDVGHESIRDKVTEIAAQTQNDLRDYKTSLDARIDAIETGSPSDTRRLERTISSLTIRLEELEHNIADLSAPVIEAPAPAPSGFKETPVSTAPVKTPQPQIPETAPAAQQAPQPPRLQVIKTMPVTAKMSDAFTPAQKAKPIPPNPYVQALEQSQQQAQPQVPPQLNPAAYPTVQPPAQPQAPALPEQSSHIPSEFDPRQFIGGASGPAQMAPPIAPTPQAPPTPPAPVMPAPTVTAPVIQAPAMPEPLAALGEYATQPYADPAYAETDEMMDKVRIGGEAEERAVKLPKLSSQNLRVAAMATGAAVIGLVAAKGFLGVNKDDVKSPQFAQTQSQTPNFDAAPPAPNVIEPIGNYTDNKAAPVTGEAAKTLNSAASAGDAVAQFQLGLSYLEQGRTSEGVDLIRKAANQKQPAAQYRLAKLYEVGEGVTQDSEIARQLTERAARNGNRIAMHDLALYYAEGRGGVTTELPTAAKWFEKAAERGVVDSQFNLGVLFESGQGLPKSLSDAFVWYSIAASQGDQFAKQRIQVLSANMTSEDLSAAQSRIDKFTPVKIDEMANGIFHGVAWNKSKTDSASLETSLEEVQTLLSDLGYDIGTADGAMGPRTRAAIMSFEQANGLPETGRVNSTLLERLELAAGV